MFRPTPLDAFSARPRVESFEIHCRPLSEMSAIVGWITSLLSSSSFYRRGYSVRARACKDGKKKKNPTTPHRRKVFTIFVLLMWNARAQRRWYITCTETDVCIPFRRHNIYTYTLLVDVWLDQRSMSTPS